MVRRIGTLTSSASLDWNLSGGHTVRETGAAMAIAQYSNIKMCAGFQM